MKKNNGSYVVFSIFMMLIMVCGTILLVCNMYNGHYFEPIVHVMSVFMILGSIVLFLGTTIVRIIKRHNLIE